MHLDFCFQCIRSPPSPIMGESTVSFATVADFNTSAYGDQLCLDGKERLWKWKLEINKELKQQLTSMLVLKARTWLAFHSLGAYK